MHKGSKVLVLIMKLITVIMVKGDVENAIIVILTSIWPVSLTRGGSKV